LARRQWHVLVVLVATVAAVWLVMGEFLFRTDWPLSGDLSGHLVAVAWLRELGLHSWTFGWFGGMPLFYFYFPLPAALGAAISEVVGLGPAMRFLVVIGPLALPLSTLILARAAGATRPEAAAAGIGALIFLHLRFLTILGGTLEAAAIGEYSYSIALALGLLYLGSVWRGSASPARIAGASALLAGVALSHLIVLLLMVVTSAALLARRRRDYLVLVFGSWSLGFLLSAFWTLPFLLRMPEMAELWWRSYDSGTSVALLIQALPLALMALIGISISRRPFRNVSPFGLLTVVGLLPMAIPMPFFPLRGLPVSMLGATILASVSVLSVVSAARARGAPGRVGAWGVAAVAFLVIQSLGPSRSSAITPFLGGDTAAVDRAEWIEMRRALDRLPPGAVIGAVGLPDPVIGSARFSLFGRPSMSLLPLIDGRRTLHGLLRESAPVSQYVREAEQNLTGRDPGHVRPFSAAPPDFSVGVDQAAALGIRYLVLVGESVRSAARHHEGLKIVAESGYWAIAEIVGGAVILSFSSPPVNPCTSERMCREWFATVDSNTLSADHSAVVGAWQENELELLDRRIRFRTATPGLPHVVRLSYFPGWRLETPGRGPERVGPNHMLIIPTTSDVELSFSPGGPVAAGRMMSLLGLVTAVGLALGGARGVRVTLRTRQLPLRKIVP
jgi:hypothetical protein